MPGFSYKVIDSDGRERKGNMNAPTKEQVQKRLTAEGLIIVDVDPIEILDDDSMFGRGKVTRDDIAQFCLQMSHLLNAGIGTLNSLRMMSEQTDSAKMINVVNFLADQVQGGEQLNEAMAAADVFPASLVAAVEAGELKGSPAENLERMGEYYANASQRSNTIKKSVIYPSFVMLIILFVVLGVLVFVVPGFMGMIDDLDIVIPLSTRVTVGVSNFCRRFWWIVIIAALLFGGAYYFLHTQRVGRLFYSRVRVNYPGMFKRKQLEDMAIFTRLMSTLMGAGIPLVKALELAGNSFMDHIVFRRAILRAKDYVAGGGALSKQMIAEGFFPKMFVNMVSIGEETGRLAEMFDNAASYYEKELDNAIRKEALILEPLMVMVLAIILGFVVISLLRPLLALFEAVENM